MPKTTRDYAPFYKRDIAKYDKKIAELQALRTTDDHARSPRNRSRRISSPPRRSFYDGLTTIG